MLSHHISGQQGIVEAGLIPVLVALLIEETDDIKVFIKIMSFGVGSDE